MGKWVKSDICISKNGYVVTFYHYLEDDRDMMSDSPQKSWRDTDTLRAEVYKKPEYWHGWHTGDIDRETANKIWYFLTKRNLSYEGVKNLFAMIAGKPLEYAM